MKEPFGSLFDRSHGNLIIRPVRGRAASPLYSPREREFLRQARQPYCPCCEHCKGIEQERIEELKRLSELERQKKEDYEKRCKKWVGKLKKLGKKGG